MDSVQIIKEEDVFGRRNPCGVDDSYTNVLKENIKKKVKELITGKKESYTDRHVPSQGFIYISS